MAFELGVEIGTYTHIAGSLHLYERNIVGSVPKKATKREYTYKDRQEAAAKRKLCKADISSVEDGIYPEDGEEDDFEE
ncbi:hypothetical protein D3C73_1244100 [compost metagenome]